MERIDPDRLDKLKTKMLGDVAGAMGVFLAYVGDQTGVYRALAANGRSTSDALARLAGVDARYLREWLSANAAFGYVVYHDDDDTFSLTPEQAELLAQDANTNSFQPFFQGLVSQVARQDRAVEVFRSGSGRDWGDHAPGCFCGVERGFRVMYQENLLQKWIPATDGVSIKLEAGAKVADVGCGNGASALLLARAFPKSTVIGFDFHGPSIAKARTSAAEADLTNVRFEIAGANNFPGDGYDLVCVFDALHDMGDPVGAARHVRQALKPDGTFMVVEPVAEDELRDNLTQLAGIYYGFSTTICLPTSRAQEVALCLGAQAGPKRIADVLRTAGFTRVRHTMNTESNMILEARP